MKLAPGAAQSYAVPRSQPDGVMERASLYWRQLQ